MPFGYYKVSVHRCFTIFANCKFKEVHQMSMSIKKRSSFQAVCGSGVGGDYGYRHCIAVFCIKRRQGILL